MVGSVGGWEGKEWIVGSVRGCIELLYTYKQIYHSCVNTIVLHTLLAHAFVCTVEELERTEDDDRLEKGCSSKYRDGRETWQDCCLCKQST